MKYLVLTVIYLMICNNIYATDKKTFAEKEAELVNFDSIEKVLKNDMLDNSAKKKKKMIIKYAAKRKKKEIRRYNSPRENEFMKFFSELWISKRVSILKWDFKKPDYGLDIYFEKFLNNIGYLDKNFSILLLDTPLVTHFSLPASSNDYIFLLSVPFIKSLDMTKLEISILLFEDIIRSDIGVFKDYVLTKELRINLGHNFYKKKIPSKVFIDGLKKYDTFVLKKGFNFQQQYQVTKKMEEVLKGNSKYWLTYVNLLKRIDGLIKSNPQFSKYNEIYPSPEMQLSWISVKKD